MRLLELSGCPECFGQAEVIRKVPKGVKRVIRLEDVRDVMRMIQRSYGLLNLTVKRHIFQKVLDDEDIKVLQDILKKIHKINTKIKKRWLRGLTIPRYVLTRRGVLRKERTLVF